MSLFLLKATSSLWIFVSFYANRNYISKNICINRFDLIPICEGQCYLTTQLKKNDKQEQKLPELKQKETQLFYLEERLQTRESCIRIIDANTNFFYFSDYSDAFIVNVFQPPRQV